MLDPQKIVLLRVKQAYALNTPEAEGLLSALSPDGIFPYAVWEAAYSAYWKSPATECSRLYKFDNPPFPEIGQLPEKYFPTETYAQWMVDFFYELARRISVTDLENGFDYIVEATYDDKLAVNEADRDFLFYHIKKAGNNTADAARTRGLREINVKLSAPQVLLRIFPDTIAVDKIAAIHYLSVVQGYPFVKEVKGITRALVDSVIKAAADGKSVSPEIVTPLVEAAAEVQPHGRQHAISIPRSLWAGKTKEGIRAAMREANFGDEVIAHVLLHKRGLKLTQREIGELLSPPHKSESTYDKNGKDLVDKAALISVIDTQES